MSNMFNNYETTIKNSPCYSHHFTQKIKDSPKLLTNLKGELLGVQVDHDLPLKLYFHLENSCEVKVDELLSGVALFEILTTTHKVQINREFSISEILNLDTYDLCISLTQAEMSVLKKETYNMKVTLKTTVGNFVVFTEKDGYLVVR